MKIFSRILAFFCALLRVFSSLFFRGEMESLLLAKMTLWDMSLLLRVFHSRSTTNANTTTKTTKTSKKRCSSLLSSSSCAFLLLFLLLFLCLSFNLFDDESDDAQIALRRREEERRRRGDSFFDRDCERKDENGESWTEFEVYFKVREHERRRRIGREVYRVSSSNDERN